jgi:hypothetical protein
MAYRVELAKSAGAELEELYLRVVGRAPTQGAAWFNRLEKTILSLDLNPERCPIAAESFDPDQPVRVLNFGRSPHVIACSSRLMNASASFGSCTSGVERGKGRHPVNSRAGSASGERRAAATRPSGGMP